MPQTIETLDELLSLGHVCQVRSVIRSINLASITLRLDWPESADKPIVTASLILSGGKTHEFQTTAFKLSNLDISIQQGVSGYEKVFDDVVLLISDEGEEYSILSPSDFNETFRRLVDVVPDTYELTRLHEFASAFRDAYSNINDAQPSSGEMQIAIREWANPRSIPVELLFKKAPEQPVDGEQQ